MARFIFAPISIVAGLIAGLLGRKLFEGAWSLIDDQEPPDAEHREMQDFTVWALSRTLAGTFALPVYQELGFGKAELDEIKQFRRERAAGGDETAFRKYFRRDLHDGLVRNLRKVGLLTERITPSLQSFGIKLAA